MSLTQTFLDYHRATREQYQTKIPSCCSLQSADEHEHELLFCFQILEHIKNNKPIDCERCAKALSP